MVYLTKSNPNHRNIYDWLAREVYLYLNNSNVETCQTFDDWHHEICLSFIQQCNNVGINAQYGMAQKFLNLLMKYVYCFGDANTLHRSKFEYCHFILDGYTYFSPVPSYIGRKSYGSYTILTPFYATQVLGTSTASLACWSNLSYEEYINIQDDIRVYLNANPLVYNNVKHLAPHGLTTVSMAYPLTAFETEFFIW
jgi:hypothetical protein